MSRRQILYVSPEFVLAVCREVSQIGERKLTPSGVPIDSRLHNFGFSDERQAFYFVVEHSSFEDVPEGSQLPALIVEIKQQPADEPEAPKRMVLLDNPNVEE